MNQTVKRIRNSFESGEIKVFRWVQGKDNFQDALSKRNTNMNRMMNHISSTEVMTPPQHRRFDLNRNTWT